MGCGTLTLRDCRSRCRRGKTTWVLGQQPSRGADVCAGLEGVGKRHSEPIEVAGVDSREAHFDRRASEADFGASAIASDFVEA